MFGFYNVNKPAGITSHDVVDALRRRLGRTIKVGHAGTLDPFATGVLVLCVGPATRLADYVQAQLKRYTAEITLGATSTTDDVEGEIADTVGAEAASAEAVSACLGRFVGDIEQVPPAHSAVHVAGKRAYELARRGQKPQLQPRQVTVHRIDLLRYEYPILAIDVQCSSGTYIRGLARDIGADLGTGGYCSALTRTQVGSFDINEAKGLDHLDPQADLIDPLVALDALPKLKLSADQLHLIRQGRPVQTDELVPTEQVALVNNELTLVAIASVIGTRTLKPKRVFAPQDKAER